MNKLPGSKHVPHNGEYSSPTAAGHHGMLYQIKLLLHSTIISKSKNYSSFKISTERNEFGKFQDICIEYFLSADNDQNVCLLLMEAKHKLSPNYHKIKEDDLFGDDKNNAFSIYKFFNSFLKTAKNKKSYQIENIYVVTNTWFADDIQSKSYFIERPNDQRNFFNFGKAYQLNHLNENIINILKTYTTDIPATETDYELFIKKFIFIIKTPSQEELDQYIIKAMKENLTLDFFDLIYFKKSLLEFLNNMVCRRIKPYLCVEQLQKFYTESKLKLATLSRFKNLRYGVKFSAANDEFINSFHNLLKDSNLNRIVIKTDNIKITSYKIWQCIPENFKLDQNIIFVTEKEILDHDDNILDAVKENFQSSSLTITIIQISNKRVDRILQKLGINEDHNVDFQNKLVLISLEKIRCTFTFVTDELKFSNLDEHSKEAILQRDIKFLHYKRALKQLFRNDDRMKIYDDFLTNDLLSIVLDSINKEQSEEICTESKLSIDLCSKQDSECLTDLYTQRYISIDRNKLIPEKKVFDEFKENVKVIILTGPSGMGKSSLLKSIQKEFYILCDIKEIFEILIHVELIKVQKILNEFKKSEFTKDNIISMLIQFFKFETNSKFTLFTEEIIKYHINNAEPLLLLDGIDEIAPLYTDLILNLVKYIEKSFKNIKIIITTRPSIINSFMNFDLDTFYEINNLTRNQQTTYLVNYWEESVTTKYSKSTKEVLKHCADTLVCLIQNNLHATAEEITSIPLLLHMLAVIYKPDVKKLIECIVTKDDKYIGRKLLEIYYDISNGFNLFDLYDKFMESQFDYHLERKENCPLFSNLYFTKKGDQYPDFLSDHQALALWIKFDESTLKRNGILERIKNKCENIINRFSNYEHNYGVIKLIKSTKELHFMHWSYVDYFVASYFMDILKIDSDENILLQMFFVRQILMNCNYYKRIIKFCDEFLKKNYTKDINIFPQLLMDPSELHAFYKVLPGSKCHSDLTILRGRTHFWEILNSLEIINSLSKDECTNKNKVNREEFHNLCAAIDKTISNFENKWKDNQSNEKLKNYSFEAIKYLLSCTYQFGFHHISHCILYNINESIKRNNIVNCSIDGYGNKDSAAYSNIQLIANHLLQFAVVINYENRYKFSYSHNDPDRKNCLNFAKLIEEYYNLEYVGVSEMYKFLLEITLDIRTYLLEFVCPEDENYLQLRFHFHFKLEEFKKFLLENIKSRCENYKKILYINAFLLASKFGNLQILNYLLDFTKFSNDIISKCMLEAAVYGHLNVIEILLNKVNDINGVRNSFGNSMIHLASQFNHLSVVEYLLNQDNIKIDAENNQKETALFIAVKYAHLEVTKILLKNGANSNHHNRNRFSPLRQTFAEFYPVPEIREILWKQNADVNLLRNTLYAEVKFLNEKYCGTDLA